jgi:4-hydroxy-2-oxoheptanedioate aldolase
MRPNNVRSIWKSGGCVVNGWLSIPSGFAAEVMAHQGWDSLTVDMQHGVVDYQAMVSMFQGISTTSVVPMARVPWNDPAHVMKALDAGAYGIICPMVNNREEAEKFVGACRYAPRGYRSSGPIRATLYGGADYQLKADDEILAIAMIETKEAVKNLDKILSTPGLDGVYVGPSDLSISYGMGPGMDHTDEKRLDLIMKILKACKKHGVHAGLHTGSTAYAKRMREAGYQLTTLLNDSRIMAAAAKTMVDEMRGPKPAEAKGKASAKSVY